MVVGGGVVYSSSSSPGSVSLWEGGSSGTHARGSVKTALIVSWKGEKHGK